MTNLNTKKISSWCPGCYNFQILAGVKKVLEEKIHAGQKKENFMMVSGIGCHGKIFDYINLNGIHTLHGRTVMPMLKEWNI
jgi:2-oxoglutarate ferredoxin oxidoreductase subunit beta